MKIEKINDDKIRIILSYDELEARHLSITEFSKDAKNAQEFFLTLFEETNLDLDFLDEDSQILLEASINNENLFVLTVTKIYHLPDIDEYKFSEKTKTNGLTNLNKSSKHKYAVNCNIFEFENIDHVLDFARKAKIENLFCGLNKLYKYNSKYFVIFKPTTIRNKRFLKTFILLSEFCNKCFSSEINTSLIEEKSKLILNSYAMQKLAKF